jgi:hypothetical protein
MLCTESEKKEERSHHCVWIGFKPCSLQSTLLSGVDSLRAAHEVIHVIERKGMSYMDHKVQQHRCSGARFGDGLLSINLNRQST